MAEILFPPSGTKHATQGIQGFIVPYYWLEASLVVVNKFK